jgi:tetratricopeptide (TPR) repeat protein
MADESGSEGASGAFDTALELRDKGEFSEALSILNKIITTTNAAPSLLPEVHLQAANMCRKLGLLNDAESHFLTASRLDPQLELASVGLYISLFGRSHFTAAAREMYRFLTVSNSQMYRELLCPGYEDGLPEPAATIVRSARKRLDRYPDT